jgi:hypothetical protein
MQAQEQKLPLKGRCWRLLTNWLPRPAEKGLKSAFKAALRPFGWKEPNPFPEEDLGLRLDAVLRELRRLHVRLEEMQQTMDDLTRSLESSTPGQLPEASGQAA